MVPTVLNQRARTWFSKLPLLLAASALIAVSGCGKEISNSLNSWMGHDCNELVARWGPPNQLFSDGRGGRVFVYTESRQWITPATSTTNYSFNRYGGTATTVYTPALVNGYTAYRMFWADSSGTLYSWAWKGL
jgi:hypothetical protein